MPPPPHCTTTRGYHTRSVVAVRPPALIDILGSPPRAHTITEVGYFLSSPFALLSNNCFAAKTSKGESHLHYNTDVVVMSSTVTVCVCSSDDRSILIRCRVRRLHDVVVAQRTCLFFPQTAARPKDRRTFFNQTRVAFFFRYLTQETSRHV